MRLQVAPITVKAAKRAVKLWHRHLKRVTGGLFAVSVVDENNMLRGVAIVGRPARLAQDGWTCEVVRCSTDGAKNACSLLYSTCRRVAQLLGYRRCLTKTLPEEGGVTSRAGVEAARTHPWRRVVASFSEASAGRET